MRRLIATIATALPIIGMLAMTASADDAGALGYGYRNARQQFRLRPIGRRTGGGPRQTDHGSHRQRWGLVQSNLLRLRTDRRCDADFRRRRSRIPARL
jgi:hypothetical protein